MGWFETIFATLQHYWAVVAGVFGGVTGLLLFLSVLKTKRELIKAKAEEIKASLTAKDFAAIKAEVVSITDNVKHLYNICQDNCIDINAFIEAVINSPHNVESGVKTMFNEKRDQVMRDYKAKHIIGPVVAVQRAEAPKVVGNENDKISLE